MKDTVIIHLLDAYGNLIKVKGPKQPIENLSLITPIIKKELRL